LRAEDVGFVVALCRRRAGLCVPKEKSYLMETRLAAVARAEGVDSVSALVGLVREKRDDRLMWAAVEAMTSPETRFFRDREVFEAIETRLYPVLARARPEAPVRIWSAAASSGQEIYSLAMIFDRLQRARRKHLVDLAASDISRASLQRGQRGLYGQSEVQRGLPIRLLVKHFEREGEGWRLSPLIRGMVRWRRINLVAPFAQVGIFDIILCRNLIGELDASFARRVLENLSLSLAPNGFLVLGSRDDPAVGGDLLRPTGARGIYKLAAARALANAA